MTDVIGYHVNYTLLVDHPELRDGSFAPVKPGHTIRSFVYCRTQGEALNVMAEFVSGQWDFAAECAVKVDVTRISYPGRREVIVRKPVDLNPERVKADYARAVREIDAEMGWGHSRVAGNAA